MTMKGLIVTALLCLQGCATWTPQDTQDAKEIMATLFGAAFYVSQQVQADNRERMARWEHAQIMGQLNQLQYQYQYQLQRQADPMPIYVPTVQPIPSR
jgi:hypothetical protein